MQGNNLMPKHIIPVFDTLRNLNLPTVTSGPQLITRPLARRRRVINEPLFCNLGELERCLFYAGALAVAGR